MKVLAFHEEVELEFGLASGLMEALLSSFSCWMLLSMKSLRWILGVASELKDVLQSSFS